MPSVDSPTKEELEREKLSLEVAELKRSPWRRTAVWASLMPPLTVALLGVGVGWWTGFFDAQRLYLEARTQVLKREERDLEDKKTGLTAEITQLKTILADERKKTAVILAEERKDAEVEREQLRAKHEADMRVGRAEADKEKATLKRAVDETREAARRTPAVVWLDVMKRKREPWQLVDTSNAAAELLTVVTADPSLVPVVVADYEAHSSDDSHAAKLLRVLYSATGDSKWLEKMVVKLAAPEKKMETLILDRPLYWASEYGVSENPYWQESMYLRLRRRDVGFLEKVIALATSGEGNSAQRTATAISLAYIFEGGLTRNAFSSEDSYFALLRVSRDSALVRNDPWRISIYAVSSLPFMRQEALDVLARLNAEGAIAVLGVLVSTAPLYPINSLLLGTSGLTGRPQEPSERARLENELGARLRDPALKADAVRMGILDGSSETPKWEEWLRNNQELMAEWTERDLAKVRQRLARKTP